MFLQKQCEEVLSKKYKKHAVRQVEQQELKEKAKSKSEKDKAKLFDAVGRMTPEQLEAASAWQSKQKLKGEKSVQFSQHIDYKLVAAGQDPEDCYIAEPEHGRRFTKSELARRRNEQRDTPAPSAKAKAKAKPKPKNFESPSAAGGHSGKSDAKGKGKNTSLKGKGKGKPKGKGKGKSIGKKQ